MMVRLKVCEGCGALFLQHAASELYCGGCRTRFGEMKQPRCGRRAKQRAGSCILPTVQAVAAATRPLTSVRQAAGTKRAPKSVRFYRKYTESLLQRYVQTSLANGRVPSMLGREVFGGNVTSMRVTGFDDQVIFCFDVEKVLAKLTEFDKHLIRRIALQGHTQGQAAYLLGLSLGHTCRAYGAALDRLTEMLVQAGMLDVPGYCGD